MDSALIYFAIWFMFARYDNSDLRMSLIDCLILCARGVVQCSSFRLKSSRSLRVIMMRQSSRLHSVTFHFILPSYSPSITMRIFTMYPVDSCEILKLDWLAVTCLSDSESG